MKFIIRKILLRLVIMSLFLLAFAGLVLWLWNALVPAIFHGPMLASYWQALGLLVLARILTGGFCRGGFGGGPFGPGGWKMRGEFMRRRLQQKMAGMSPEEREKFKAKMQQCGWPGGFGGECDSASNAGTTPKT